MKQLVELALENLSTGDYFLFRVTCGACGKDYGGKAIRFSKAGAKPQTGSRRILFDALYAEEFRSARAASVREAAEHMNFCPICRRLVCNRCFLICNDLDMCGQCAARLKEPGSPVLAEVLQTEN